jgi:hypothetical protein
MGRMDDDSAAQDPCGAIFTILSIGSKIIIDPQGQYRLTVVRR